MVFFVAAWAFLYFVGFCYLSNAWGKTESPPAGTANNMQGAIAFCFFSIFAWVSTEKKNQALIIISSQLIKFKKLSNNLIVL